MMEILKKLNINSNNIVLYETAFTHTSYSNEHKSVEHYEKLEFLGDAVIDLIISDYLYNLHTLEEGEMTKIRASYVCENALATYAIDLEFPKYIRVGSGEDFSENHTVLADIFEAFTGAMYLDLGYSKTKEIILKIIVPYIEKKISFLEDYKSKLQELVQTFKKSVEYRIVKEEGPSHNKKFTCEVLLDNVVMGRGISSSKKASEQQAAKDALRKQAL